MTAAVDFEAQLASFLAQLREARGLSQEALASQMGRDQPFVSKIERQQRHVGVVDLLGWLTALGVPLSAVAEDLEHLWAPPADEKPWPPSHPTA